MNPRLTLILVAGVFAGCDADVQQPKSSTGMDFDADPIVPEDVIAAWGYQTTSTSDSEQPQWEAREFGAASIRRQAIKATTEVPDWEDAYYRFTLVEESFEDPDAARPRFERLQGHDPSLDSKSHPELILRDGFLADHRVLYATTDSTKFEIEAMPSVVAAFEAHVLGTSKGESGPRD